ncbi:MAG: NADP-dependent oxidoreductase [Acidimicrobiales bacterium]
MAPTVRAVGITRFGGPEVLEVVELSEQHPGPGEIRVRVSAATVNPTDVALRQGRRSAMFEGHPPPYVPGMELAGIVEALGPADGSSGPSWRVGDEVVAIVVPGPSTRGAQAESVVVPASSAAPLPPGASFAEGATLPMNGLTVRLGLELAGLAAGQVLGVTGAAGAVGGYAIELGKLAGLRVVADASEADRDLVRHLGADVVVPRGPAAAAAMREAFPDGVDAVLDAALMNQAILPAVSDGGTVVALRPFQGESERGIEIKLVLVAEHAKSAAALAELSRLAGEGRLTLRVARTLPLESVAEAHRLLEAGGVRGRLVIEL